LENKEITFYKRYVDDIQIIYDQNRTDEDTIYNMINNTGEHLEFKISRAENKTINYLDLSIKRNTSSTDLNIYRKSTYMDITIHFSSNHPYDHKLAAFKYYIHRMITMPITEQAVKQEWNKIIIMARNNGFSEQKVYKLRNKLIPKRDRPSQMQLVQQHNKEWITFTYYDPVVRKVTNLFKCTNLKIAFCPTNTIYQQLSRKPNNTNPRGIYQLKCNTRKNTYVGQSGRPIIMLYKEHLRYIRYKNPMSAYAINMLNNRHDFGPTEETLKLLKPFTKGMRMNSWEALFIHIHHRHNVLISEQQVTDTNPLFDLVYITRDLQHIP
jgi:hypothetical protein